MLREKREGEGLAESDEKGESMLEPSVLKLVRIDICINFFNFFVVWQCWGEMRNFWPFPFFQGFLNNVTFYILSVFSKKLCRIFFLSNINLKWMEDIDFRWLNAYFHFQPPPPPVEFSGTLKNGNFSHLLKE